MTGALKTATSEATSLFETAITRNVLSLAKMTESNVTEIVEDTLIRFIEDSSIFTGLPSTAKLFNLLTTCNILDKDNKSTNNNKKE